MKVDAGGGANLEVEPDKLLKVAATIKRIATERRYNILNIFERMPEPKPGEDHVSSDASQAWIERLYSGDSSHQKRGLDYMQGLHDLSDQLVQAARQYGYTDEDIKRTFDRISQQR